MYESKPLIRRHDRHTLPPMAFYIFQPLVKVYWLNILNKDSFGHSVSNKLSLYSEIKNEITDLNLILS